MFRLIPARAWTPCPRKSRVSPTTLRKSNPASASSTSSSSISRIPSRASTPKSPALPRPRAPPTPPPLPVPPSQPPPPAPHRAPPPFPAARPPPTLSIPTASATSPAANTISPAPNSRTTSSITPTPTSPPTPSSISARLPTPRKPTTSPSPNMKKFSTTIPRASSSPPPASRKAWLSSNSARKPPASANSSSATPAPKKTAAPAPNSKNSPSPSPPPAEILFPIPQLQRSSALLPARQPFNVSPSHFFPIAAKRLRRGQSRFSAPCGTALLRFYGSPRLRNACWEQVGLNGNFLARQQADFRLERLVSGKRYLDAMFSRAHQHAMSDAAEFAGVPHKGIVDKNRGAIGTDIQLDLRCDLGQGGTRSPEHDDLHDYSFFRLDDHLLREVCIAGLANRDFMFTRQKKEFIVAS